MSYMIGSSRHLPQDNGHELAGASWWKLVSTISFFVTDLILECVFTQLLDMPVGVGTLFTVGILAHEMGHLWEAQDQGITAAWPAFSPIGAFVQIDATQVKTRTARALVFIWGPLVGLVYGTLLTMLASFVPSWGNLLLPAAFLTAMTNLFNLIPFRPFDGGGIAAAIGNWMKWFVGLPILISWFFIANPGYQKHLDPLALLIFAAISWDLFGYKHYIIRTVVTVCILLGALLTLFNTGPRDTLSLFFWLFQILAETAYLIETYRTDMRYALEASAHNEQKSSGQTWFRDMRSDWSTTRQPHHPLQIVQPEESLAARMKWFTFWLMVVGGHIILGCAVIIQMSTL